MNRKERVVVIGGGMAGLSTAAALAGNFDVTVVEAMFQPGYHSTGRSAAVFHKPFVNDVIFRLSCASESTFLNPPQGFERLATPLIHLPVASTEAKDRITEFLDTWQERCPWLRRCETDELRSRLPALNRGITEAAIDDESLTLDVSNLLTGYRRQLRESDGKLLTNGRLRTLAWHCDVWKIELEPARTMEAEHVINAAGAWADEVAIAAGLRGIDLVPKRRTGVIVDPQCEVSAWPMCYRVDLSLYFKPESGLLMASPADETPSPPCDAQPEDLDVAVTIDRLQRTTTLSIERPQRTWAGLRSFVDDGVPVIGPDLAHERFFWVAALGGFGIQTAPAYSTIARAVLTGEDLPQEWAIDPDELSPARLLDDESPSGDSSN